MRIAYQDRMTNGRATSGTKGVTGCRMTSVVYDYCGFTSVFALATASTGPPFHVNNTLHHIIPFYIPTGAIIGVMSPVFGGNVKCQVSNCNFTALIGRCNGNGSKRPFLLPLSSAPIGTLYHYGNSLLHTMDFPKTVA